MSDRHSGYFVALEADLKDEDSQAVIDAIRMIRGVAAVEAKVLEPVEFIARARIRIEMAGSIMELIQGKKP